MLTSLREVLRTPVYIQESGWPLGQLLDLLIDPDTGVIHAVWVKTTEGLRLLPVAHIIHWNEREILVDDSRDLLDPDEAPKLKEILEKDRPIMGVRVFGMDTQTYLGRVRNLSFKTTDYKITHLRMRQWKTFRRIQIVIPIQKVYQILPNRIMVYEMEKPKIMKDQLAQDLS